MKRITLLLTALALLVSLDSCRQVAREDKRSTLDKMQGSWYHDKDHLATVTINKEKWTFHYAGEDRGYFSDEAYSISFTDKMPGFLAETEKAEFLILTRGTDTMRYEILGFTDNTFSLMNVPDGGLHLYWKQK